MTTATSPGETCATYIELRIFEQAINNRDAWSDPYVSTYRRFRTMVESWVRLEKGSRAHSHQAEPGIHPLHGTQPLRCVRMCNLGFVQQYMVADPDIARIVVLLVIYLSLQLWARVRAIEWTRCAITRCREIMTPQLSIVKTRFAKASLRPRCARHRSWHATCRLPNRRAGTLSFPIVALDTQLPNRRAGTLSFPMVTWVV